MGYRSERIDVSELPGLGQVYSAVDGLEALDYRVDNEVMAGTSHRRRLHEDAITTGHRADYLLQVTLYPPLLIDKSRHTANYYIRESGKVLGSLVLPGDVSLDDGGLNGLDPATTQYSFRSTGDTQRDILDVYAPWLKAAWSEKGKYCLFFCGVLPPPPQAILEEYGFSWDEKSMRHGKVVFQPTPEGLETY